MSRSLPKVTVIVVNYNISRIYDIVRESIEGILGLDYRPLEIILVDNGSSDNTYRLLVEMVDKKASKDVDVKILRLSKNYGFAVANNIAFMMRSK
ncbi:MAG: glycosyltransferase, partial [Sulfolobales archaeon]|nr:glycosyltransferase [Sulfolobales archaeon]